MGKLMSLFLAVFFVLFAAGCATVPTSESPQQQQVTAPVVKDTREFFSGAISYSRIGSARRIMDDLETLEPTRLPLLKKKLGRDETQENGDKEKDTGGKNIELELYRLYVQADTNGNGEIDEKEAAAFKAVYTAGFNSRVGSVKF